MDNNIKFTIEHLSKSFEKKEVLKDIDFTFFKGKISACRKSSAKAGLFVCYVVK